MKLSKIFDVNTENFKLDTIDKANVVFWRWNEAEQKIYLSDQTKLILGYKDEDLGGPFKSWEHIWYKDERNRMLKIIKSSMISGKTEFTMLHRFIHKDQSTHWYFTKGSIIKDEFSQVTEVHGFSVNADDLIRIYRYLNLSEHDYLDYINAADTATWYWNIQTGETTFNDRWAQMIGYTLEELEPLTFDTWKNHVHPDDVDFALKCIEETLALKTEFYENTFRMVHKDGSEVWIHDRGKIIEWTTDKKPLIMMGTHNDVTQSKMMELKLVEDEKRYKNLVESSYDIIYTIDLDQRITFISLACERLLGYETKEVSCKSLKEFIHPEDYTKVSEFLEDVRKTEIRLDLKYFRLKHKNNSWRYFNTNAITVKNESGSIIGYSGSARDITSQRLLEEELSKERDLFKKTLLSVGDGIISTDHQGKIVMLNPIAQKFVQLRSKDTNGKDLEEIFTVIDNRSYDPIGNIALDVINNKKAIQLREGILNNHLEEQYHIEYSATPIEDIHGIEDGVVIVFRDISERVERLREIEYLSYHDYLTGLYNRRYYEEFIKKLDKKDCAISMMLLDVNDLKVFNDTFGHDAGDNLIKKVSHAIESLATEATVCRIGGDEFVILYDKDIDLSALEVKIKNKLDKIQLYGNPISVSIGFNKRLDKYDRIVDIQKRADMYLYECKNRYHKK